MMMTSRFKYGCACMLISILLSLAIMLGFIGGRSFEMVALIAFMIGLAELVEVDF